MNKTLCKILITLFLVLCIGFIWFSEKNKTNGEEDTQNVKVVQQEKKKVSYKFRNLKLKNDHYKKHGEEMGFESADEYEKAASDVINNKNALTKTEKEDGDYVFYIEKTNEFVVLSKDGYIRTYFLPNAGKKYYDKQ